MRAGASSPVLFEPPVSSWEQGSKAWTMAQEGKARPRLRSCCGFKLWKANAEFLESVFSQVVLKATQAL